MLKPLPGSFMYESEEKARNLRQLDVLDWTCKSFTEEVALKPRQRAVRFFEEACELFQAVYHKHRDQTYTNGFLGRFEQWAQRRQMRRKMIEIVDYVLSREPGEVSQEIGGNMITLMGVAEIEGVSLAAAENTEFKRIYDPIVVAKIQSKQLNKVHQ